MSLQAQRAGLEQLGFKVVDDGADAIVATQSKFHWDCIFTKISYLVFVRRVAELTPAVIDSDRAGVQERAAKLDPSVLPRGLQKGTAVIVAYLADRVSPEARAVCETKPATRFAYFYLPGALDGSTGNAHYLRTTPMWGAIYFSKFRFLLEKALKPGDGSSGWPVSVAGILLTICIFGGLGFNLFYLLVLR